MLKKISGYLHKGKVFSRFYVGLMILLRLRKPRLLYRIFRNYFMILVFGKRYLRSVDFAPAYACNLHCRHCFASRLSDNARAVMTPDDYRDVARQAKRLGAVHFAFQGGEPLLLTNLEELIRAIGPSDCLVSITTNGYLLTEEMGRSLKKSGVDMLTISIDSGIAEEHDDFRGMKGAFDRAVQAIKYARACGMIVTVNTIVNSENLKSGGFEKIVLMCRDMKLKLNILYPAISGKLAGKAEAMLLQEEMAAVRSIIAPYKFIRRDLDANYVKYGCGAVKEMIYISAYGDVMPCSFIHAVLGNIRNDSLESCIKKGLGAGVFSEYLQFCPPMEGRDFIGKHMSKIHGAERFPPDFSEVF